MFRTYTFKFASVVLVGSQTSFYISLYEKLIERATKAKINHICQVTAHGN